MVPSTRKPAGTTSVGALSPPTFMSVKVKDHKGWPGRAVHIGAPTTSVASSGPTSAPPSASVVASGALSIAASAPRPAVDASGGWAGPARSEEHTSELQSHSELVCRLLLEKKK